jgi:hypothetical protein
MAGLSKKDIKYRVRSIDVPEWYVAERMGSFGRMGTLQEAMQETKEFWKTHLNSNWERYFTMEPVEDG